MAIPINQCPVRWQAINNGRSIALQNEQQKITYGQLDRRLINLQNQLTKQIKAFSIVQPIRLVCIATNSIELLLLQLLCVRLDWIFCPLNPRFTQVEIKQRLAVLNSDYCWVRGIDDAESTHLDVNTLHIDFTVIGATSTLILPPLFIDPQSPCNIVFTSGSSGFPKAIVHHYKNHFFSALGSQTLIPLTHDDHNLLSLPLFHIGGYATVIRSIIAGACIHLTQSPLVSALLLQRKITHLSLVSTQLIRLLNEPDFNPLQCPIKHILLGGSAFSIHLLNALRDRGFNYHISYGCTEMASQVATSHNDNVLKILPYRQVKIQENEIFLRGETRFMGYFQDQNIVEIDPNEWIASGDTGSIKKGRLKIDGRKDRQFISGGENIKPEEIERICLQQKNIQQAYIYPFKNSLYGQRMALFVAFNETDAMSFEQQIKQLKEYLSSQLTRFKQPDYYLTWPKLTNTLALKIPKQAFKAILKNQGMIN